MQYFQIFSSFLIFCCYLISFKIWETRRIFPILHSAPYDNNYVSMFQLLMLVLLNTLSLAKFLFIVNIFLFIIYSNFTDIYTVLNFCQLALSLYTAIWKKKKKKRKEKEMKKWKRKEKVLLIPARSHASVKNIDPDRTKITPKDKDVKDNSIIITCLPLFKILIKIRYHPSWN